MRYVKTTTVEHSLELDGDELQDFLRGELRGSDGEVIEPPECQLEDVKAIIPRGGDYSGMSLPIGDLKFHIEWKEDDEEVDEDRS